MLGLCVEVEYLWKLDSCGYLPISMCVPCTYTVGVPKHGKIDGSGGCRHGWSYPTDASMREYSACVYGMCGDVYILR